MTTFECRNISYKSAESQSDVNHFVVVSTHGDKTILLSHPNLFLYYKTRASIKTSQRYSAVISMFYRYVSGLPEFESIPPTLYHLVVTNRTVRRWQISREIARSAKNQLSPTSSTILADAKILMGFFHWLNTNLIVTSVNISLKTWIPKYKSTRFLEYVSLKARNVIDYSSIKTLDKVSRQKNVHGLISNEQIQQLISCYHDPVYASMFMLALGTAMRPMDLCEFPYAGNGLNRHITPLSWQGDIGSKTVQYQIYKSKGGKFRRIQIHVDDLRYLEDNYIRPHYKERAKKYELLFGKPCPPSILFLNGEGKPVTPKMIANRTLAAKNLAVQKYPGFPEHISFYESRHWWPTQYLIGNFGDDILYYDSSVLHLAFAQFIQNQMGHTDIKTTFTHYMNMAKLIVFLNMKSKSKIFTAALGTTRELIGAINNSGHV